MDARADRAATVNGQTISINPSEHPAQKIPSPDLFESILFIRRPANLQTSPPGFFEDLNCDQIVDAIVANKQAYNLKEFFYTTLHDVDAVDYRQEVMRDLENDALRESISVFAQSMRDVRDYLVRAQKLYYAEQQQAWFLDAVQVYCRSIRSLSDELRGLKFKSHGFFGLRDYIAGYAASDRFRSLVSEVDKIRADLATIAYNVQIKGNGFTVSDYRGEPNYSSEVEATFEKFKQGAAQNYLAKFGGGEDMNHIEAKILEFVAKLHADIFTTLANFCQRHADFLDPTIATFDREIQFYVAYLEYIAELRAVGLRFCYPSVSGSDKEVLASDGFDIALAKKHVSQHIPVICNDFQLRGHERVLVISGPNQGGKTTFARTFGQIHYLASLGCPVPGREAKLLLFDLLLTHFEKEERVENHRGKLEDDLLRVRQILCRATSRSIVIMNEIFTSTTIQDEIFLSKEIMARIIALDLICVWVSFADELASFAPTIVSMVSMVVPENPAQRTFKVIRRPADGRAYAMAIAAKYGLTYDLIKERIKP